MRKNLKHQKEHQLKIAVFGKESNRLAQEWAHRIATGLAGGDPNKLLYSNDMGTRIEDQFFNFNNFFVLHPVCDGYVQRVIKEFAVKVQFINLNKESLVINDLTKRGRFREQEAGLEEERPRVLVYREIHLVIAFNYELESYNPVDSLPPFRLPELKDFDVVFDQYDQRHTIVVQDNLGLFGTGSGTIFKIDQSVGTMIIEHI